MTGSVFVTATALSYGLALVGYLAFALRVAVGSRKGTRARLLLFALMATAAWSAACLAVVFVPSTASLLATGVGDALRYGTWYAFLSYLLGRSDGVIGAPAGTPVRSSRAVIAITGAALIASVLAGEGSTVAQHLGIGGPRVGYVIHLALAVFGLVLVEQLVRRIQSQFRWAIKPLAVALAGIFALDLFFYADAMLFGQLDPNIWVSRGLANVIVIPLLAIATARNTGWTVDLHLSRQAVFQSSALLLSGAFLLAVAAAGYFVRYFGGDWGRALQIELLFAAMLFVALVASSGRFRSRLKVFVSKHFFSYRYDYREEWLRFTRALSAGESGQRIHERVIMALADLVESPAGALWLRDEARGFVLAGRCSVPAMDAVERPDSPLVAFLEGSGWIVSVEELRADPSRYDGLELPPWLDRFPSPWLIVPLMGEGEMLGFVVLARPRTPVDVDWEVRDLLKTASRQAASYLGQMRAAEALLEARKFDAFNRMSAFVVHDLKNLVAQLSLMLKNAKRHRDNPEFQADMLTTVGHVVGRMNALMLQLRTGAKPVENPRSIDLESVIQRVCAAKADPRISLQRTAGQPIAALGHEDRLEH
ncbi:MAG: XrtA/PEP-CTERM system histidine kinase PrsK, partial [Betaproteobacteria bacterium]